MIFSVKIIHKDKRYRLRGGIMTDLIVSIILFLIVFSFLVYEVKKISASDRLASKAQYEKNRTITNNTVIALCVILGAVFIFDLAYAYRVL